MQNERLVLDKKRNKFVIDGKDYPMTGYNYKLFCEYRVTAKNKKDLLLNKFSEIVLDI